MRLLPLYLLTSLAATLGTLQAAQPWIQQSKVTASRSAAGNSFGRSVAIDGDTAIVGAAGESSSQGAAYVFVRNQNSWTLQQRLIASDGLAFDAFGSSVAISGNTVIVGALTASNGQGAAYVFVRSGTSWSQQQKLSTVEAYSGDNFGAAVAVAGDTAIVGMVNALSSRGVAYVYTRRTVSWSQQAKLQASDAAPNDRFGREIAISADTAIVTTFNKDSDRGAAYVFTRSGTVWTQQQSLTAADGIAGDLFGRSVALDTDTALVGAPGKNSNLGAAYIFTRTGATWTQSYSLVGSTALAGDYVGISVSLRQDLALIGAYPLSRPGAAYLFNRTGTAWTQNQILTGDTLGANYFGEVALSADSLIVGAPNDAGNSQGAAYLFGPGYNITVQTNPPGRSFSVDGTSYSSSQTFAWLPDSVHSIAATSPQTAGSTQYVWNNWSDGGLLSHAVTATADATYSANFTTQYLLTTSASPSAGGTVGPVAGFYNAGQNVVLSATSSPTYTFQSWTGTGSGSYSGTNPAGSVTMNGPITQTASFTSTANVSVTIATNPPGQTFSVDGTPYTSIHVFSWPPSSVHTIATTSPQAAGTSTQYVWSSWSDSGAISHSITATADAMYTAFFTTQYLLTNSASPVAGGSVSPVSGFYNFGANLALSATANPGYTFQGWTGTGTGSYSGSNPAGAIVMNGPITQTATFNSGANVTVQPQFPGLAFSVDGTTYTQSQSFAWTPGSQHTISAVSPQPGPTNTRYVFSKWSDDGSLTHTITAAPNGVYTVFFTTQYLLTTSVTPAGSGTASPATGYHDANSTVSLSASPVSGYIFAGWSGTGYGSYSGLNAAPSVVMYGPMTETATFANLTGSVTVQTNPPGLTYSVDGASYTGMQIFDWVAGTSHTIATTSPQTISGTQYTFSGWSDSGAISHSITASPGALYTASFTSSTPSSSGNRFIPVAPCRVLDTRLANGLLGGPSIARGTQRDFPIPSSTCSIPATATAYSLNVTVVPHGPLSYLTIWPTGETRPLASTLNSDGRTKANAAIAPAGVGGSVSVFATDDTDVILDINGYFVPATSTTALSFYPVTPCRIIDTRNPAGVLGGPILNAGQSRTIPVLSSDCGIPATAKAYSLNMTAVPPAGLSYLSTWPTGQAQPFVSTLNAPLGGVVANAAIVPAGLSGGIDVYVTHAAHLVLDIDGYFADPGAPGALSFYALTPCRIIDTRNPTGPLGGPSLAPGAARSIPFASSACSIPSAAQAYSVNATVVPATVLGYLTLWPTGIAMPLASTLNAPDGSTTANAALVPAGTNGSVSAYVTHLTDLILDLNGYFAP